MKKQVSTFTRSAEFRAATLNSDSRTVDMVWTTGARVLRNNWLDGPFYEELLMEPAAIRLGRLNSGAPLLNSHMQNNLSDILGVVEKAWLEGNEGRATVRFSERADVEPIYKDVAQGIIRNVSVGYRILKMEKAGEIDGVPIMRATDWEPFELSAVPVGADAAAGFRGEKMEKNDVEIVEPIAAVEAAPIVDAEPAAPVAIAEPAEAASVAPVVVVEEAPRAAQELSVREAVLNERKRTSEILEICQKAKLSEQVARQFLDAGDSIENVRKGVIDMMQTKEQVVSHRIESGNQDEVQTRREGIENAILVRAGAAQADEKGRKYVGLSLPEMARQLTGQAFGTKSEVASRALSSADFPLILSNVAEKMMMTAYAKKEPTFKPFVKFGTLVDYKSATRYQIGDAPSLAEIKEGGEYTYGSFGEKAESMSLKDYGKMIKFTRQMLINDDLNAFSSVINSFGSSANRLESKLVYDLINGNPTMADGVALFHANHGNLASASAITEAGLTAVEKLMMEMKTLDGEDYLNVTGAFLICGTAKKVEAQKILSAQFTATKNADVNPFQNAYQLIVDPRITGNTWYLAASPNDIATIELAYLEGESGPVIEQKEGWNSDGLEIKCRHTLSVKALEWKGLVKNPGA